MDCEKAAEIIFNYIDSFLFEPAANWPDKEFQKRSYSRWAAYELIERIMDHPLDAPIDTIDKFVLEMDYFASCFESKNGTFIFQTALETANDLILLFV